MKTRKREKKLLLEPGDRLIFQLPDEMIPDFNDLKSVGYGDTEIVVECLKIALAEVKASLLERRAKDAANLYAKQANYLKKIPATHSQTQPGAQHPKRIHERHGNSEPKTQ